MDAGKGVRHGTLLDREESNDSTPGRVHATFESAGAEAVRLTEQMPESPAFMVLKVVGVVAARAEARADG
ncbi:hypothetical protein ACMGDH_05740 [Sphingomonas sp. DT-207]